MIKNTIVLMLIFLCLMLVVGCVWASGQLAIRTSFAQLWKDPWFKITVLDLYIGFGLFMGFVMYKEKSIFKCAGLFILIAGLGNIVSILYVLTQLYGIKRINEFWEAKRDHWQFF